MGFRLPWPVNTEIFLSPMSEKSSKEVQKPDLKITKDGSHTLYSYRFNQHYHNPNGAVAESKHNFFETNGLYDALKTESELTILEVGFGTGLNLLLLMDALIEFNSSARVRYHTIEAFPIDAETAAEFNFEGYLTNPELAEKIPPIFEKLEKGLNSFQMTDHLEVFVFKGFFKDFTDQDLKADYIFHDAFSPEVNEELWAGETFKKLKELSGPNAILTTYSAASKAKGAMAWAGWKIAKAQGALGKREMTVASLNADRLTGLERANEEHLAKRYEQGDF